MNLIIILLIIAFTTQFIIYQLNYGTYGDKMSSIFAIICCIMWVTINFFASFI